MSLKLLFFDELRGYAKSKVMVVLWVGLPLLALLIQFINPSEYEGMPVSFLVSLVVSSIGGTLSAIMLSTSIVSEKNRHVYELFLIRPVRRSSLILAKYLAVYSCLVIAVSISLSVGLIIDIIRGDLVENFLNITLESLLVGISSMSITCSIGIFFGVLVSSVPVAAILSVYLGSQLSSLILLPTFYIDALNPVIFALSLGISLTGIILFVDTLLFNRQQF
ncbi:MAG: ABC-2 transporter permease [Candidatus Lokiarchaeota archaeon]|nr:ABC-2 transporter permease [Candidatus Lokiarchaeota archaeon]